MNTRMTLICTIGITMNNKVILANEDTLPLGCNVEIKL